MRPARTLLLHLLRQPDLAPELALPQWDIIIRQARAANLLAALDARLERAGVRDCLPPQPRAHLDWMRQLAYTHARATTLEIGEIRKALAGLDLPLILLKGAAYNAAGMPVAQGRLFADIDILVPKERLPAVESALLMHGWAATVEDEYDQHYYRTWMHEIPPMQHVRRLSSIDVHHAIVPLTARETHDAALLGAAALPVPGWEANEGEVPVQVLAPSDMVLHCAVHLFNDGEFDKGLRDLLDFDGLLRHFGAQQGFWDGLLARACQLKLQRPLFYGLRHARALLDTPLPAEVENKAVGRPNRALIPLMDALFSRALLPAHASSSDLLTGAARGALYVRGNWLRMPPLLLARHLGRKAFMSLRREE